MRFLQSTRFRCALVLAVAVLLLNGCRASRPAIERELPSNFPNHSFEDILFNVRMAYPESLHSFRAKVSLALRTPEQSGSFSADVHERMADSLYVSISPGLGIEAARALVTPDSFFFYDRIKNRLTYGSIDAAEGILPQPFASADIFRNLLGLIAPPGDVSFRVAIDDSYYVLTDPAGRLTYVVDPAFWRIVRRVEYDEDGTLLETRSFSEFDTVDGLILPRRVEFSRPEEETRASIYYRSLTLNPQNLSFDFNVRDSAERIHASR